MGQFEAIIGVNFWTALAVLLNTLTIFFVGKKFLFGPVMNMIRSRQQEIDRMYSEADAARESAAAMQTEYAQKLAAAQETGAQIVRDATERAQKRETEIVQQAGREADAIREKASADIAREKRKALGEAKDEISSLALEIAGKVVGETMDEAHQKQLVERFLEELGDGT